MLFLRVQIHLDLVFCTGESSLDPRWAAVTALKAEHVKTKTLHLVFLLFVSPACKSLATVSSPCFAE